VRGNELVGGRSCEPLAWARLNEHAQMMASAVTTAVLIVVSPLPGLGTDRLRRQPKGARHRLHCRFHEVAGFERVRMLLDGTNPDAVTWNFLVAALRKPGSRFRTPLGRGSPQRETG
jgi:hypothetical protein